VFYALLAGFAASCVAGFLLPVTAADLAQPPVAVRAAALGIVILGTLVAVSLHEWAHAAVAYRGGDTSVAGKGYLTLDFRRYSDPLLSIGMPVLFLLLGALPLPGGAVWINQGALRSRWWRTAVSLAGSAMNLLVGLLAALVVGSGVLGREHPVLTGALAYLALIMFGVAILNLLPIPGLDGYGALEPHLPRGVQRALGSLRPFGLWIILGLMLLGFFGFIWTAASFLTQLLGVDPRWIGVGAVLASVRG
jgi:Zn-dependent protease